MSCVGDSPQDERQDCGPSQERLLEEQLESSRGKECENGQPFSTGSKTLLGQDRRWGTIAQQVLNRYRLGHSSVLIW